VKTLHLAIISITGIGSALAFLMILGNIGPYTIPSHDWNKMSETQCSDFHAISENKPDFNTVPILIIKPYTIGCAKITFTVDLRYDDPRFSTPWPRIAPVGEMFHIGKYNYTKNDNQFSVTSYDTLDSFQTAVIPETVDLANYQVGDNFTVTYVVKPLSNSTGFYDYSIPRPMCNTYPLAVGYDASQVNSSDFSLGLETMLNHSCMTMPYVMSKVEISGMDYTTIKLH
jgi:hypothetical protein